MSRLTLHPEIPTLKLTDKLATAALLIQEFELGGLPILKHDKLVGTLLESDVEMLTDAGEKNLHRTIGTFTLYNPLTLDVLAHPFQAIKLFGKIKHDFLPVIDKESHYSGLVLREETMQTFFDMFYYSSEGVLFEVEAPAYQFKMSDMVRLLEQNETTVISIASRPSSENPESQLVTMVIQSRDSFRLQRTLERYGYHIAYNSNPSEEYEDDLSQKAQAFLKYLEM